MTQITSGFIPYPVSRTTNPESRIKMTLEQVAEALRNITDSAGSASCCRQLTDAEFSLLVKLVGTAQLALQSISDRLVFGP